MYGDRVRAQQQLLRRMQEKLGQERLSSFWADAAASYSLGLRF